MSKWYLYKDTIHGIEAASPSKRVAWALIRNECHSKKIEVPTMDKVQEVRELSEYEVKVFKNLAAQ